MGNQSPLPTEAAPAYEDLFAGHDRPGNTASGYASIPQTDLFDRDDNPMDNAAEIDPEQADAEHVHLHNHGGQSNRNDNGNEADRNADPGQPHVHCTACDNLLERKERRLNQRHCCTMLAVTFTTAFLCLFFFGLAVALVKKK